MNAASAPSQLGRELAGIVGPEHVCDDQALLKPFAIDGVRPAISIAPGTAEEVAAVLQAASKLRLSVMTCGGFSKQTLGRRPQQIDILLRTDRLNQVLHFDPGDLTIGVSAGMRVAAVQRLALESKLLFPLDVGNPLQSTIGGSLATASSGPLKHGYGGVREYCIGVSFVTGDGRIAKAGGRVVKNVAGYDLMKLLIGSHGSLGVIVSANFKLFPAPRQTCTYIARFASAVEAVAFRRFVQRSPLSPICLEIVSPLAHAYLANRSMNEWSVALRAAGSDAVLSRYRRELGSVISDELAEESESTFWGLVQGFSESMVAQHHNVLLLTMHLPAAAVPDALTAAERIASDHNFLFACLGRVAVASLTFALMPIAVDPPSVTQYASAVSAIRASLPRDTAAIVYRCPQEAKEYVDVWGPSVNDTAAMRSVKQVLDPGGILNRGRFLF